MPNPARILVLEDDEDLRNVLQEVLSDEGYLVTSVGQGLAAVEMAQSQAFDLIIADIRMEGMDGLEAVERTQSLQPGIGSLIVSGYATEHDTARAERLEVGAYIHKPFKMQDLLAAIRRELASGTKLTETAQRADFQRQALDWTLSTLARVVDDSKMLEGSLAKAADLAEAASRELGWEPEVCLSNRWVAILKGLRQWPDVELPAFFQESNPDFPLLGTLLQELELEAGSEGKVSRHAQMVARALAVHFPPAGEDAQGGAPAVADDDVLAAVERCSSEADGKPSLPLELRLGLKKSGRQSRSLVSVAHALERLGDENGAVRAFQSLTGEELAARERLEGYLGLARLAQRKNDGAASRAAAISALRISRTRGPNALSQWGLEAALILEKMGAREAEEALSAVAQSASAVADGTTLALASLALCRLQGTGFEEVQVQPLLSTSGLSELGRPVDWLFGYLFEELAKNESDLLGRLLTQVVVEFPSRFQVWFDASIQKVETRLAVGKVLGRSKFLPERVARKLFEDPEPKIKEIGNLLLSRGNSGAAPQLLRVHSFGVPEILCCGEQIPESAWKTRKIKYLFYLLASRWGQPMTEDSVMDALWGQGVSNKKKLYWTTSNLRGVIKAAGVNEENFLIREGNFLSLNPDTPRWHDLEEFNRAWESGAKKESQGSLPEALAQYRIASKLYAGPYLDGCYYEFAVDIKSVSEERAFQANLKASQLCLETQQDALALEHATDAVEMAPHQEDARACKMRALIRLGQAAQALEEYRALENLLRLEYELEPSTELIELYHRARLGYTDA